jgi:UDP:flavonoid glycosyltransferase YjiC (YdhE family)
MAGRSAKKMLPLFLEAASRLGQRTLLLAKPEDVEGLALSENVFRIESVPHDWLFPRMAAAVHHGGAGTSEAAFRAGVPQIVLPFIADQHFWAQRIAELGVGPEPLKHKKLSLEQAMQALRTVMQDQAMRKRARLLGEKVQQEHGVDVAVQAFGRAIR